MQSSDDAGEAFPLVDEDGRSVGTATRGACHGDPSLIHPSVHVVVRCADGVLWQLRGHRKDVAPATWDHACAGHVAVGEEPRQTAVRELFEELGIEVAGEQLQELGRVLARLPHETELTTIFRLRHDGPFTLAPPEVAGLAVLAAGVRPAPLAPSCPQLHAWLDLERPGWDS